MPESPPTSTLEQPSETELLAHEYRARKRKNSPFIGSLLKIIRKDPDVWDDITPVLE